MFWMWAGESTRPGADPVSEQEELDRVIPVITALAKEYPQATLSIDTYRAAVAKAAAEAGAHLVNDVWGLRADPNMGPLVAEMGVPVILMHNRSKPGQAHLDQRLGGQHVAPAYQDFLPDVKAEMAEMAENAMACGIKRDQIILDPGIGFGKSVSQNMQLINHLDDFRELGFPLLSGPSRKNFIGQVLNLPVRDRLEGTAASIALSVARGANMVRVHDVREMGRVVRMTDAMLRADAQPSGGAA